MRIIIYITLLVFGMPCAAMAKGVYQKPEVFLGQVFNGQIPKPETIWLTGDTGKAVSEILQHKPRALRIRYWRKDKRTAWILEEIGKEKPITVGIVIKDDRIEKIKVLIFRESRGWEVRRAFFTDQFTNIELKPDHTLSESIDGVSGATLSVRALVKLARMALLLDQKTGDSNDTP